MGGDPGTVGTGSDQVTHVTPRLRELIAKDELDLDDLRHREAYFRAWLDTPRRQAHDGQSFPARAAIMRTS